MSVTDFRRQRLAKFFKDVLDGRSQIRNTSDFKRFLESLFNHHDSSEAIERLVANPQALGDVRNGLRLDLTPAFVNQYTAKFIKYLDDPKIGMLCNGKFLEQLLLVVVEPPTVWLGFLNAFYSDKLEEDSIIALAWLTTELLSLPKSCGIDITVDAQNIVDSQRIALSSNSEVRNLGHKIKFLLQMSSSGTSLPGIDAAGGRHDNDFPDFRQISILPTADEFSSIAKPFYRRADETLKLQGDQRVAAHLDNQFRLTREDMLYELREDVQMAQGKKKGHRSTIRLGHLALASVSCRAEGQRRFTPCAIGVTWSTGMEKLQKMEKSERSTYLKNNPAVLKHKAFGCLLRGDEIVAFATIDRDLDALSYESAVIKLRISGQEALQKCFLYLKMYRDVEFLIVNAPIFAYEPILKRLQESRVPPLKEELFLFETGRDIGMSGLVPESVTHRLEKEAGQDVSAALNVSKPVRLDKSQLQSLIAGIRQNVSLIQGPPGTGKSFIGALLAKVFFDRTKETILVMCYTNHALDQFLEDLLDIGIRESSIVRLGSKSTQRTRPLALTEHIPNYRRSPNAWNTIKHVENQAVHQESELKRGFGRYMSSGNDALSILDYLEFEEPEIFEALNVPEDENRMAIAGKKGKPLGKTYLYNQWIQGKGPGLLEQLLSQKYGAVWNMSKAERREKNSMWIRALLEEDATSLGTHASHFNISQEKLDVLWGDKTRHILNSKRIIGCTTTGAAMYFNDIHQAAPGIILLEEAGEVLESHVLAALSKSTKQLVMIGDHFQLRPKVNNYSLQREKGDGYDLNVSLFERLIHVGYPHTTLLKQHRMCPDISALVRHLMYPDLQDDEKTKHRPPPRGLQDRVMFIQHDYPEVEFNAVSDSRDGGAKQSKRNVFEAELVLRIIKYLGQQGYGTDKLVILTPYLGQLHLLRDELSKNNDPVLNDLDSYDLVRAGLVSKASANQGKRPIKLSTIDNYQGEESDIVIASLTRSNSKGDIGFMAAAERINVLLSRARDVLIMIGNSSTFTSGRKGAKSWVPILEQLKANGHIYDGLPVKCEQHPQTKSVLRSFIDFEKECPDGGCSAPCGVRLRCGLHECPFKCHQLSDHSKMDCHRQVSQKCSRGHSLTTACFKSGGPCQICIREDQEAERKRQRDAKLDAERQRKQDEYARQLTEALDEIDHIKRIQRDSWDEAERQQVLSQHRQEIKNLKSLKSMGLNNDVDKGGVRSENNEKSATEHLTAAATSTVSSKQSSVDKLDSDTYDVFGASSPAKYDWNYQKAFLNAQSAEIDKLMDMVGLESVKEKFLSIKAIVDIAVSQNVKLGRERFGTVFIGNPGTGKTTVARLYAKFLASMGVISGTEFVETTGSKLANDGVSGCQKMIDLILKSGGGAFFIDEAYQLADNRSGGKNVLDFLLAEVENLTGKIVFILAGYQRPMEKFFAHNIGLPSRFPRELKFRDYDDQDLLKILGIGIQTRWRQQMKVEDGLSGLYCRIVSRRVGRGRGTEGFGNARAIENAITKIAERQSDRLKKAKRLSKAQVDQFLLTKEDLIGPEPSHAIEHSRAWKELNNMIGLDSVKTSISSLMGTIKWNYQRELNEESPIEYMLNKVFLGSPGTGKTTVAKLYGQILVDLGMLSNGEVVVKSPSDFVGSVVGGSEQNTKGILASTIGKVLVIDEAYGLYASGTSNRGASSVQSDPFRTAVVDTIVAEVQSTPGEDRCVLLLGYKDQMQQMFHNVNKGLSRRFPMDQAFNFEDFSKEQMDSILTLKLSQQDLGITIIGRQVALEMIERARNRLNFGNAGEIDNLLNTAKARLQKRISSFPDANSEPQTSLDASDFDENFDRGDKEGMDVAKLFVGIVGYEDIIAKLVGYQKLVRSLRKMKVEPRDEVPFNFLFRGPPGTGKTSTARKMGQVYYDMGLLASTEVLETSVTDLVGQYVGQTAPKTQQVLENALGKVLFIDEAYRLAEGPFAKEAIDELVDCITKPIFFNKLIIILAGYDDQINSLMSINSGLTSRFPELVQFKPLSIDCCIQLLTNLLSKRKEQLGENESVKFDLSSLEQPDDGFIASMKQHFGTLSQTPHWANARDVESLAKDIFKTALQSGDETTVRVSRNNVLGCLVIMLEERLTRKGKLPSSIEPDNGDNIHFHPLSEQCSKSQPTSTPRFILAQDKEQEPEVDQQSDTEVETRDPGVTEETWEQLKRDKATALALEDECVRLENAEEKQQDAVNETAEQITREPPTDLDDDAKRDHEQARLQRLATLRKQEQFLERLREEKKEKEVKRKEEEKAQKKLKHMGICPAGFRWIKQAGGYRCAGGSHFVSDRELASE